ncbi:MAG: hypothetical protein ABIU06_13650 [Anaerolineales bacterium]
MSNKPKPSSLFKMVTENTIGLVTTAIFSIGLIGGSGFLLFDAKKELNKIDQGYAEFGKQSAEINLGIEMATISGSGSFSTTSQLPKILGITLGLLEKSLPEDDLDDKFAENALAGSFKSLEQLMSEREQISGYVFSNKTILQSQSAFLKVYDSYIGLEKEIIGLVENWEGKTIAQRQSQFNTIRLKRLDVQASNNALNSARSQLKSDTEIALKQSELKFNEIRGNQDSFTTRLWLSILGVILGSVLLFGPLVYIGKKYFQQQKKPSNNVIHRAKKSKGKKR